MDWCDLWPPVNTALILFSLAFLGWMGAQAVALRRRVADMRAALARLRTDLRSAQERHERREGRCPVDVKEKEVGP